MNDDTKILARCISIWKSPPLGNLNEVWSLDAVLQDQQGNRYQATIKGKHINKFQLLLDEGACYRIEVIETVVSVSDVISFNNYGKDQLRRTIILEDVHLNAVFDAWSNKFAKLHDERETMGHVVMILQLFKVNRTIENGWTYLACKKYRRSTKEADSDESLSSVKRAKNQQFWNCRIHKGLTASLVHMRFKVIVRVIDEIWSASLLLFDDLVFKLTNGEQCHTLIQKHGPNYDDYFPPELNVLATESDEFIKSSVENLIPIPSESEGIPEHMCDVPFDDNSLPLDVSKDQIKDFSESNDEFSSIDDNSFSIDNIDYVEASPPDSELVSSEVMEIVILEVGGIDDDILLTIKDDILREKLLNVNLLIAKIEAFNDNPTPSSDFMTKSSSTSLNSLLEETNTFDNSLPEFETLCFDVEEISSGSTTTHYDISLPEYEVFNDDHVKEISSGSTTTPSDSSLYALFIFVLLINPFLPADRSDFYEFADEFIPFISPPEYDCFLFKIEPNSRDFTKDVVEDISPTKEPQVHNALPTHPTLQLNMKFQPSSDYLFTYVVWIFLPFLVYCSEVMEIVILEVGGIDDDIPLTIKDNNLREKLLNVHLIYDAENDFHTPVLGTTNSSRFSNVANIPFHIKESPISADRTTKGSGTNRTGEGSSRGTENDRENSGSGKQTIINLDDFDEEAAISKRLKHVIQVKLEPKD
nr:replication protein A 70 kDa DNA-binding subunit B [Tanacetum cinerariifolium]